MRPIYHPHRDEITVPGILFALSNPVRVQIFSQLILAVTPLASTGETHLRCVSFRYSLSHFLMSFFSVGTEASRSPASNVPPFPRQALGFRKLM
jgi:hypothetical protein